MFTPKQQEEIKKLKEAGVSILGISKQLNISRNTVYKYIKATDGQRVGKDGRHLGFKGYLVDNEQLIMQRFLMLEGNCVDLAREIQEDCPYQICLRTLQDFCRPYRSQVVKKPRKPRKKISNRKRSLTEIVDSSKYVPVIPEF